MHEFSHRTGKSRPVTSYYKEKTRICKRHLAEIYSEKRNYLKLLFIEMVVGVRCSCWTNRCQFSVFFELHSRNC